MKYSDFKEKCVNIFARNSSVPVLHEDSKGSKDSEADERLQKLFALTERMLEVNKSMNLTAITDIDAIILKHYADSLTVSRFIHANARVIDIGCGAGFPSLPLAIFRPDIEILALDSTTKRINYVNEVAGLLSLGNITAVSARAEELAQKQSHREKFDIATARAVAPLNILAELCLPFVKQGGQFVAMKAARGDTELDDARAAIAICGGKLKSSETIALTADGEHFESRNIICISKAATTPPKYPRVYAQISKKPL